jgi:hypothetical protein
VRIKRQEHAFAIHFTREFCNALKQGSMTVVNAIKRTDGNNGIAQRTDRIKIVVNLHRLQSRLQKYRVRSN